MPVIQTGDGEYFEEVNGNINTGKFKIFGPFLLDIKSHIVYKMLIDYDIKKYYNYSLYIYLATINNCLNY